MNALTEMTGHEPQDTYSEELKPRTQLLHGQYTIERFLNSGGFALTYLARDSLERMVVIKECFPESLCTRRGGIVQPRARAHEKDYRSIVRMFTHEAHRLAKLRHPNIVGVHQVFEDNNTAYMVLDHVDGPDLLDLIQSGQNRLEPRQVKDILMRLLNAVSCIHEHSLLHRDISPDNILLDRRGNPILIDFGAARERATRASRVLSSLQVVKDGYSPQEFYITGATHAPSGDLYALAATFYHLITGAAPPSSQLRLAAVAANEPDPLKSLAGRFPEYEPDFLMAIERALSIAPGERPQSAQEWLLDIDAGKRRSAAIARALRDENMERTISELVRATNMAVAEAIREDELRRKAEAQKPTKPEKKKPFFPWQAEDDDDWLLGSDDTDNDGATSNAASARAPDGAALDAAEQAECRSRRGAVRRLFRAIGTPFRLQRRT